MIRTVFKPYPAVANGPRRSIDLELCSVRGLVPGNALASGDVQQVPRLSTTETIANEYAAYCLPLLLNSAAALLAASISDFVRGVFPLISKKAAATSVVSGT